MSVIANKQQLTSHMKGEKKMINQGDYIKVKLLDGTIFEGDVVKVGNNNMVIDDIQAFGDWVFIEFCNIVGIEYCQT